MFPGDVFLDGGRICSSSYILYRVYRSYLDRHMIIAVLTGKERCQIVDDQVP